MTLDFDARLAESRLPLDDDEREMMRAAVAELDQLVGWLDRPPPVQATDPLDGWTPPGPSSARCGRPADHWPMPTVATMAASLDSGETNARTLTERCLDRIAHHNDRLAAFLTVTADRARTDADIADTERRQGRRRGPLHGIPYALKDAIDTAGVRTTMGSRIFADRVPDADAAMVQDLRRAGAVLIGKLDTTEFCLGGPSTDGGFGPANNPWDLTRHAGGSSSGAGTAIAAGLVPLAFGTDTGGSVRFPAALTGVAGFKPSHGLISTDGVYPLSKSLDHVGPLAATPRDCGLAIAAFGTFPAQGETDLPDAAGLTIGVPRGHGADCPAAHPDAVRALFDAAGALAAAGAAIRVVELPSLWAYSIATNVIVGHEGWRALGHVLAAEGRRCARLTRLRIGLGAFVADDVYARAKQLQRSLADAWHQACAGVDVMLTIGTPGPAPVKTDVGAFYYLKAPIVFCAANIAGAPSLNVRAATSDQGLPIGVQISGRRGDDRTVLTVGQILDDLLDRQPPHPPGFETPASGDG